MVVIFIHFAALLTWHMKSKQNGYMCCVLTFTFWEHLFFLIYFVWCLNSFVILQLISSSTTDDQFTISDLPVQLNSD